MARASRLYYDKGLKPYQCLYAQTKDQVIYIMSFIKPLTVICRYSMENCAQYEINGLETPEAARIVTHKSKPVPIENLLRETWKNYVHEGRN